MNERTPQFSSEKIAKERPPVFPDAETWHLSLKFAHKYPGLKEDFEIGEEMRSVDTLVQGVEEKVAMRATENLSAILHQSSFTGEDQLAILKAVVKRDFSEIDFQLSDRNMVVALSLALVVEKARSNLTATILEKMNAEKLSILGMTPDQRDIIAELLRGFSSVDNEFLRFKIRAMKGEKYPERPVDAARESLCVTATLERLQKSLLQKGAENVFGESGNDFLIYIKNLSQSYRPVSNTGEVYTQRWRKRFVRRALNAFKDFTEKHPNHPLIIVPATGSYVETSGVDLGFDPELRVLWQSPHELNDSLKLKDNVTFFADVIKRSFPEHISQADDDRIRKTNPIVCDDIGSFGVNMTLRAEALVWGDSFFIIRNREKAELFTPGKEVFKKIFGNEWDAIIDSPAFFNVMEQQVVNHELGHKIYEEIDESAANNFGRGIYESIEEHKADLLSSATLSETSREYARKNFPQFPQEAINLSIIIDAVNCARFPSNGELGAYHRSAVALLNYLDERQLFVRDENGVRINKEMLKMDLGEEIFESQAETVLGLYRAIKGDSVKEKKQVRKYAEDLMSQEPGDIVKEIISS
ncbi:MAG: hypothetical protein HYV51_02010 [Parcubacteria group bacterium]|nr:hypothetical protein [Parcubacteria group bacterium]